MKCTREISKIAVLHLIRRKAMVVRVRYGQGYKIRQSKKPGSALTVAQIENAGGLIILFSSI